MAPAVPVRRAATGCAVIGDIRGSSSIPDWRTVFRKLGLALDKVNRACAGKLLAPFRPTVGDEFQGVVSDAGCALDVMLLIEDRVPARFYLGVGVGTVEIRAHRDTGMRGTAFYRARAALEEAKAHRRSMVVRTDDESRPTDQAVNALLRLRDALRSRWTARQRELITFYRAHPDYSYADLAEWLHKSPQAVHKRLKAASWDAVVEAERAAGALLQTATGRHDAINITGLKSDYQPHKVDGRRPR
jgi:predicted DNA-binding protein YlxM (UPF0122 family)